MEQRDKKFNNYEWNKSHKRFIGLSLSISTDKDIIDRLDNEISKQGFIKQAIREKIASENK